MGYGVYRIDFPDIAFDGGVGTRVQLIAIDGDGGAFTEIMEVELSAPVNTVAVGGTTQTANDMSGDVDDILTDTANQDTADEMQTLVWDSTTVRALTILDEDSTTIDLDGSAIGSITGNVDGNVTGSVGSNLDLDSTAEFDAYNATVVTAVGNIETDTAAMDTAGEWDTLNATLDGKLDTIVTAVGNIETDTAAYDTDAEYATAIWDALTNAYGGVGTYAQATEDILGDTGTDGVVLKAAGLDTDAVTEIWAQAMKDLTGVPAITDSVLDAINWIFEVSAHKTMTDDIGGGNVEVVIYKADGSTKLAESDIADDGTDFTRGAYGAPD